MLNEDQIKKFQQIYKEKFGKQISKEEALNQGVKLITLMEILIDSQMKNQSKTITTRDKQDYEKSKSFYR